MNNNNSADRRIFARISTTLPVRFLASGSDNECQGQAIDVSANGIGILSKDKLSPRTLLELWLEISENQAPFYTRGEVVWSRSSTDVAECRSGVRLDRAELMGLAPILWK